MSNLKVKVKRTDLIAKIEVARTDTVRQQTTTEDDVRKWQSRTLATLSQAIKDVKAGKDVRVERINERPRVGVSGNLRYYTERMDRDLRLLRMSTDEFIVLSADSDLVRYV